MPQLVNSCDGCVAVIRAHITILGLATAVFRARWSLATRRRSLVTHQKSFRVMFPELDGELSFGPKLSSQYPWRSSSSLLTCSSSRSLTLTLAVFLRLRSFVLPLLHWDLLFGMRRYCSHCSSFPSSSGRCLILYFLNLDRQLHLSRMHSEPLVWLDSSSFWWVVAASMTLIHHPLICNCRDHSGSWNLGMLRMPSLVLLRSFSSKGLFTKSSYPSSCPVNSSTMRRIVRGGQVGGMAVGWVHMWCHSLRESSSSKSSSCHCGART